MWFENIPLSADSHFIGSRIRLARNLEDSVFPAKLDAGSSLELVNRVFDAIENIGEEEGISFRRADVSKLSDMDRMTLRERRIINGTSVKKKTATGIMVNSEEDVSILINADDHVRLQLMGTGLCLEDLYRRADRLDDYINDRFPYAFHKKYGYLTSYPTKLGTGLKAGVLMHLPALSKSRNFSALVAGITSFGVEMRGVYEEDKENHGSLFEISNPKTLGQSERELLDKVNRVAIQLNIHETRIRRLAVRDHRLEKQDEVFKSYGILQHARKLTLREGMIYLSTLMRGAADELIRLERPQGLYGMMVGIQPSNILNLADKPLSKEESEAARAEYVRRELPPIGQ